VFSWFKREERRERRRNGRKSKQEKSKDEEKENARGKCEILQTLKTNLLKTC